MSSWGTFPTVQARKRLPRGRRVSPERTLLTDLPAPLAPHLWGQSLLPCRLVPRSAHRETRQKEVREPASPRPRPRSCRLSGRWPLMSPRLPISSAPRGRAGHRVLHSENPGSTHVPGKRLLHGLTEPEGGFTARGS